MIDTNLINLLRKSEIVENLDSQETKDKVLDIYNNELKPELDKNDNAAGLSAIQVGIPLRIFVIRNPGGNDKIYINPSYTPVFKKNGVSKKISDTESCLSFPDIFCLVERYKKLYINGYQLLNNEIVRIKKETIIDGFEAIVFQHEYDHLEGITILQKAQRLAIGETDVNIKKIFLLEDVDDYIIEKESETIFKKIQYNLQTKDHYAIGIKNCKQNQDTEDKIS